MSVDTTRRHADGTIDYDFYRREARTLRNHAQAEFFRGRSVVAVPLAAAVVLVASLTLAALVHELRGGSPTPDQVTLAKR